MKRILLFLLAAVSAIAAEQPTNVQKLGSDNTLTGSIVVGNGKSITATGNGTITATGISGNATLTNATLSGNTTVTGNITVSANATFSGSSTFSGNTTLGNLTLTGLTYGSLGVNGSGVLKLNKTVYASSVATLDSNVLTGGGTDVTSALQTVLNLASIGTVNLELVMDGPALVTGLRIYGNTTIRCLTQSCGFFLKAQSNVSVLRNATPSATVVTDKHIRLIGGTYNGNSANQTAGSSPDASGDANLHAIAFYGVDDVRVTGVATYYGNFMAYMFSLWSNVWIENCQNVNYTDAANDAFHFVGSGSYLTVKNVSGSCGADFIPLNSSDYKDSPTGSSWVVRDGLIQHVLIDGVFLKNTRNGVGIVSGASGAGCDDIVVRNVQGTCQAYAVSLWNPWSTSYDGGYIGTVLLDGITATNNIANAQVVAIFSETNGTGPTPGLNRIRNLRITGVQWDVSNTHTWLYIDGNARINALEISGVAINEATEVSVDMSFMVSGGQIDRLTVNNLNWLRPAAATINKTVIQNGATGVITQLNVNGVSTNRVNRTIGNDGTITNTNDWVDNTTLKAAQLTSTVATGTAPLIVASTTNVANLNSSTLLGSTWASPAIIGSGTPAAATFAGVAVTGNNKIVFQSLAALSNNGSNTILEAGGGVLFKNGIGGSSLGSINTNGDWTAQRNLGTTNGFFTSTVTNTAGGSSVANYAMAVVSTVNQTGAANFSDIIVYHTTTAAGSGAQNLIDLQVGGVPGTSKFKVDTSGNITNTGTLTSTGAGTNSFGGPVKLQSYIVSGLPSASTSGAGSMAYVTDSTATAITGLGLAVIGSGSNKVVVVSDGTNWIVQ